jgi:L-alanine-DL-glutamate epimerase-like enolase superfamily enzyme
VRVGLFERLAELPLLIEECRLQSLEQGTSSGFLRRTTVIELRGGGQRGFGEDPGYNAEEQAAFVAAGAPPLAGSQTLAGFSSLLAGLDLFPLPPQRPVSRSYRRWGFESAGLDLALRQAGRSLAEQLGREPRPLNFVSSFRLDEPPSLEPLRQRRARVPGLRFKLDATSSWGEELIAELAATGAVDIVDLKGLYRGTVVDQPADPALYRRLAEGLPEALLEDPALTPETEAILLPHERRISWDEPIHSVADLEALPARPGAVNIKPARFGSLQALLETYEWCDEHGIPCYGGGSFELGPGRDQIQYLASLFSPLAPNDVAPAAYNRQELPDELPSSPLEPRPRASGFAWDGARTQAERS